MGRYNFEHRRGVEAMKRVGFLGCVGMTVIRRRIGGSSTAFHAWMWDGIRGMLWGVKHDVFR